MKLILFVTCCLWLSAYSRNDYDCQGYMEGNVNMSSISYVENLVFAEPFEMVTVFFTENIPCHKRRSWFGGFKRIRSFAAEPYAPIQSDNETCINYLNLTWDIVMEMALLSPTNDVIFTQIDSNYSSVRPICVQNKTAHYIKLQIDATCDNTLRISCFPLPTVSTYTVPCSCIDRTSIIGSVETLSTLTTTTTVTTVNTTIGSSDTTDTCAYLLPLLSSSLGVLSAVLVFIVLAMFIYIRCTKHTGKRSKTADNVYAMNPTFKAQENNEQE